MPSVHGASAVLTAMFGFAFSRFSGLRWTVVALFTFAASIGAGCYDVLDGYVLEHSSLVLGGWLAGLATRDKA